MGAEEKLGRFTLTTLLSLGSGVVLTGAVRMISSYSSSSRLISVTSASCFVRRRQAMRTLAVGSAETATDISTSATLISTRTGHIHLFSFCYNLATQDSSASALRWDVENNSATVGKAIVEMHVKWSHDAGKRWQFCFWLTFPF